LYSHVRAQPAAVMATRWSRAHGELYLRRKWNDGGVTDVEELPVVLWLRGIGQWRSVLVDLARRLPRRPGHRARVEENDRGGNGERKRE